MGITTKLQQKLLGYIQINKGRRVRIIHGNSEIMYKGDIRLYYRIPAPVADVCHYALPISLHAKWLYCKGGRELWQVFWLSATVTPSGATQSIKTKQKQKQNEGGGEESN